MKKIISALVATLAAISMVSMPACTSNTAKVLAAPDETKFEHDYNALDGADEFLSGLAAFSSDFSATYAKSTHRDENFSVSPVSVFTALALTAKCSYSQTKTEILNALNLSEELLDEYVGKLYRALNVNYTEKGFLGAEKTTARLSLTNSLWLCEGLNAKQNVLNELAEKYFCYSYEAPFSKNNAKANKDLTEFVKKNTNGLIDKDFKLSVDTLFALVNTLYIKEIWTQSGDELPETSPEPFANGDGTTVSTRYLYGNFTVGKPYADDDFSSFYTVTAHGYKLCFILPQNGKTVDQIFTAQTLNKVINGGIYDPKGEYTYETRCIFPSFTANSDNDIKGILKDMGINELFSAFCNMKNLTDEPCCCNKVIHSSKLKVDKTGIEGAAVTAMVGDKGASEPFEKIDYKIDKAFGFVLLSPQNVPLFSGMVNIL